MSILDGVDDKRNYRVGDDKAFVLVTGEKLATLDELSEAINHIEPETFHAHVNEQKNDFAAWVEHVFGESNLAQQLREHPTPLRMMVSIEKFLRQATQFAPAPSMEASVMPISPEIMPAPETPSTDGVPPVVETVTPVNGDAVHQGMQVPTDGQAPV